MLKNALHLYFAGVKYGYKLKGDEFMNIEKYTQNAQSAIIDCQNIAMSEGHQMLEGEHLHLALLMQNDGLIPKLLQYCKVDVTSMIADLQGEMEKLPKVSGASDNMYSSRRLSQILLNAEKIAEQFKDEYVSVEHLYQIGRAHV